MRILGDAPDPRRPAVYPPPWGAGQAPPPVPGPAPTPAPAPAPAPPPQMGFDYQSDPGLVAQRSAAEASLAGAKSRGLEAKRKALLAFGSADIAKRMLGADDPTIAAISGDPANSASILGRIAKGYNDTVASTEEDLNQNNLFFGGHRGKVLTALSNDRQQQEVDAQRGLEDQLSGINEGLSGAEESYRNSLIGADQDAYQRAQDRALQYGIGPEMPEDPGAPGGPPGGPPGASAAPLDHLMNKVRQGVHQHGLRLLQQHKAKARPRGHAHAGRH